MAEGAAVDACRLNERRTQIGCNLSAGAAGMALPLENPECRSNRAGRRRFSFPPHRPKKKSSPPRVSAARSRRSSPAPHVAPICGVRSPRVRHDCEDVCRRSFDVNECESTPRITRRKTAIRFIVIGYNVFSIRTQPA